MEKNAGFPNCRILKLPDFEKKPGKCSVSMDVFGTGITV
jgi:hypothetical protein